MIPEVMILYLGILWWEHSAPSIPRYKIIISGIMYHGTRSYFCDFEMAVWSLFFGGIYIRVLLSNKCCKTAISNWGENDLVPWYMIPKIMILYLGILGRKHSAPSIPRYEIIISGIIYPSRGSFSPHFEMAVWPPFLWEECPDIYSSKEKGVKQPFWNHKNMTPYHGEWYQK